MENDTNQVAALFGKNDEAKQAMFEVILKAKEAGVDIENVDWSVVINCLVVDLKLN